MDKIWYRNPSKSEVIGRCGGDEKKRMTTQNRQKSNAKYFFIYICPRNSIKPYCENVHVATVTNYILYTLPYHSLTFSLGTQKLTTDLVYV